MFHVPVIDISAYRDPHADPSARAEIARALDEACAGVGFIQIVGHGVAPEVMTGLADALDEFYALPLEVKKRYTRAGENRGYSPPKSESLSMSLGVAAANQMNDFYEAFTVGSERDWYPGVSGLPVASYPTTPGPTRHRGSGRPSSGGSTRRAPYTGSCCARSPMRSVFPTGTSRRWSTTPSTR